MRDTLSKKQFGKRGEDLAANFLRKNGYRILERNFLIRGGEVDIIAQDKDVLVFVEVKARYSHEFGLPAESITYFKLINDTYLSCGCCKAKSFIDRLGKLN